MSISLSCVLMGAGLGDVAQGLFPGSASVCVSACLSGLGVRGGAKFEFWGKDRTVRRRTARSTFRLQEVGSDSWFYLFLVPT